MTTLVRTRACARVCTIPGSFPVEQSHLQLVVLDCLMALLTLLWGASLAIALVSVLVVLLARWTGGKRSLKVDGQGRVLLITAHPDDECMFFAPAIITLTQANVEIFLLCLSEGHFYNTVNIYMQWNSHSPGGACGFICPGAHSI